MMGAAFDLTRLNTPDPSASAPPGPSADDPVATLRLQLAVRGWTRPMALVEDTAALSALSSEVETAENSRPGQWFLSSSSRRLALAAATKRQMREAVAARSANDRDDPVRLAFGRWLRRDPTPPERLPEPQIAAFINLIDWLGERWDGPFGAAELTAEAARRRLHSDIGRMTQRELIGATHRAALTRLRSFALSPSGKGVEAVYIHGGGGAGKTTVLAFLQRELMDMTPPATVLRIDFDEPAIDPARMVTLNIAVVDQLSSAIPGLRGWADQTGAHLRRIAATQRSADASRGNKKRKVALSEEMVRSRGASDESSVVWGMLRPDRVPRPLVLILDTAELVLAHSDRIAAGIADWIAFLCSEGGAQDLRLVIAGRDPPPTGDAPSLATSNLFQRLSSKGIGFAAPVALSELSVEESAELLRTCGLTDETVVRAAAEAVPGNPLLLRITADALLRSDGEMARAVQQAHAQSTVDPASARSYLMRRLVAHVPDAAARPYVLGALYLPSLTRDALEAAVIPAVDRAMNAASDPRETRQKAARVFAALAGTTWLTRPSLDPECIPFNRELRDFALQLLAAMPEEAALERDLRQLAAIHHLAGRGPRHRAFAVYHLSKLGLPVRRPRGSAAMAGMLRDVLAELPPPVLAWFEPEPASGSGNIAPPEPAGAAAGSAQSAPPAMSDADWRLYLEGDAKREGEGSQLVRDDKAREALQLYLERPTREPDQAPTFVIRALAELGEWDHDLAHPAMLEDAAFHEDGLSERLYWITRLTMLQHWAQPTEEFIEALERAARKQRDQTALVQLAALITIAELATGRTILTSPARELVLRSAPDIDPRILMAADPMLRTREVRLSCRQLAVVQTDWLDTVAKAGLQEIAGSRALVTAQKQIRALHGQPLAAVNTLIHALSEPVAFRYGALDPVKRSLLLRGQTPEFHGPLREALLTICGDGIVGPKTRAVCDPVLGAMSIRPAEMEPQSFYDRLSGNPRVWSAALVGFADQCRLLPLLAERLRTVSDNQMVQQIAASFAAWDNALGHGSSLWGQAMNQPVA